MRVVKACPSISGLNQKAEKEQRRKVWHYKVGMKAKRVMVVVSSDEESYLGDALNEVLCLSAKTQEEKELEANMFALV